MDDPNRNTRSPSLNPDKSGRSKWDQPTNDSPDAMAKAGYRVLDRADRWSGGKERPGLSQPEYPGMSSVYPMMDEGFPDYDD